MYKILVLNLGSTSTKIAYYENELCKVKINVEHPAEEIKQFNHFMEQNKYREKCIEKFLEENSIDINLLDVIVSRGGHTKPLEGGIYRVCEEMLKQQASGLYGQHPCDLGSKIAYEMCENIKAFPLIVDPPITDEFEPLARLSGHPLIERRSSFHALSHKA
ncbi:MAG: butyrate kinase, partial [Sedimentibacter sp.]